MRAAFCLGAALLGSVVGLNCQGQQTSQEPFPPADQPASEVITTSAVGSTYVPMDSWIYPALDRLQALGYVDSAFMGLRPWTRVAIANMLERSADRIETDTKNEEAAAIYRAVSKEVQPDIDRAAGINHPSVQLDSVYTILRGIGGTPLRDSFHLGQSIINDYGRPYAAGFDNYTGASARAEAGPFSLYLRGEYQHAPSAAGYSTALATNLSENIDDIPLASNPVQATLPEGPLATINNLEVLEATLSYHLAGHEVSFGKSDHWMGPDLGASMLWSDNAEDIWQFQIDRAEPLRIPGLSRVTGPFRYDFFVGSLVGHTAPANPWVHVEKISFKPTRNLEFGFSRMVVWGGRDHEPITLHTFLKSFFSFQNVSPAEKLSRSDPGARFGTFDFSWRLPGLEKWVTLYTDSLVHDDVSPISAPRRAGFHPGIYLSRFPGLQKMDLRLEGAYTEPVSHSGPYPSPEIDQGQFLYWEGVQKQGPTNKGFLPDWVGRQGKGGQAWLTWHLSPQEDIQFMYRRAKASALFIPGGTTQNDVAVSVQKRLAQNYELRGLVQYEGWKAPIYQAGAQSDTVVEGQITWFPNKAK